MLHTFARQPCHPRAVNPSFYLMTGRPMAAWRRISIAVAYSEAVDEVVQVPNALQEFFRAIDLNKRRHDDVQRAGVWMRARCKRYVRLHLFFFLV